MTMWEKIKTEAKARHVIGFLVGTILAIAYIVSYFVVIPKENEIIIVKCQTVFEMAFAAYINHLMKTPEKEKQNGTSSN